MDNKTDKSAVGKRIRNLRETASETQKELADVINTTPDSISKIENGIMGLTFDNMILIAEHYKVSLDYLCKGEGGTDLLDTLLKYVNLSFDSRTDTLEISNWHSVPVLSINKNFFEYLMKTAKAKANKDIPEDLRQTWIDRETETFKEGIKHDSYQSAVSIIPVKEELVWSNNELLITVSNTDY